jgi:hypothetical protein
VEVGIRTLPLTFRTSFETVEGGTQVTFRYDANPNVVLKLLEPLLISIGKRQLDGDIPKLRDPGELISLWME